MATILTIAFAFGSAIYVFSDKYVLVAVVIAFYLLIEKLLGWHKRQKFITQAIIHHAGKVYKLKAFIDTGNALIDPISRNPVNIISLPVFLQMFPEISADLIIFQQLDQFIKNGHYIDCKTVNGEGNVFVFSPEQMQINGTKINNSLLGVSTQDFGYANYDALLNVKMGGIL